MNFLIIDWAYFPLKEVTKILSKEPDIQNTLQIVLKNINTFKSMSKNDLKITISDENKKYLMKLCSEALQQDVKCFTDEMIQTTSDI